MSFVVLTNEEKVAVSITPKTAAGNPAQVDGTFTLELAEGDVTFEVAEDGTQYVVCAAEGTSKVKISADADLGEGVQTIEDIFDVIVVPAGATNLGVGFGTPVLK